MIRASSAALLLLALAGSSGLGQEPDWATKMFDHTSHDFGTVVWGAKVEHTFTVENKYEEDMYISEVRSTCGCTATKISKRTLKTWEKAEITAVVDTRGAYSGRKDSTLTVVFGGQFPAEVQLHTHVYIRRDIVVKPGSVEFGSVSEGAGAERKVTISYAPGRPDWAIEKIETKNPYLEAKVVKLPAGPAGQVVYELTVKLKPGTPLGYIRDYLILGTNDPKPQYSRVPLAVGGLVAAPVAVRPSPLLLGVVKPGQSVTRRLIVRGNRPFRILSLQCADQRVECSASKAEKTLHQVSVTFTAGAEAGKVSGKIRIRTSLTSEKELEAAFHAQVIPPEPAKGRVPEEPPLTTALPAEEERLTSPPLRR